MMSKISYIHIEDDNELWRWHYAFNAVRYTQ
jgi:hypothetical protein